MGIQRRRRIPVSGSAFGFPSCHVRRVAHNFMHVQRVKHLKERHQAGHAHFS